MKVKLSAANGFGHANTDAGNKRRNPPPKKRSSNKSNMLRVDLPVVPNGPPPTVPTTATTTTSIGSLQAPTPSMFPPTPQNQQPMSMPGQVPPRLNNYHNNLYPYYDSAMSGWNAATASSTATSMYDNSSGISGPPGAAGGLDGNGAPTPRGYIGCLPSTMNTGPYVQDQQYHHTNPSSIPGTYPYPNNFSHPGSMMSHQQHMNPYYRSVWNDADRGIGTQSKPGMSDHIERPTLASTSTRTSSSKRSQGLKSTKSSSKKKKTGTLTTRPRSNTTGLGSSININTNQNEGTGHVYQSYINQTILEAADDLELPPGGSKFSNGHWGSALRLFYRWKTTIDETEMSIQGSALGLSPTEAVGSSALSSSASSSSIRPMTSNEGTGDDDSSVNTSTSTARIKAGGEMSNDTARTGVAGTAVRSSLTKKSVKAFVDKVLRRESKRRQFSIHWKDCGLKEFFEKQNKDERHPIIEGITPTFYDDASSASSSYYVPFDHPQVSAMLDDYFSGRKRSRDYVEAEQQAKVKRQQDIDHLWDILTGGLPRKKLKDLQYVIEAPYKAKIIVKKKGSNVSHEVTLDGFGGEKYKPITKNTPKTSIQMEELSSFVETLSSPITTTTVTNANEPKDKIDNVEHREASISMIMMKKSKKARQIQTENRKKNSHVEVFPTSLSPSSTSSDGELSSTTTPKASNHYHHHHHYHQDNHFTQTEKPTRDDSRGDNEQTFVAATAVAVVAADVSRDSELMNLLPKVSDDKEN